MKKDLRTLTFFQELGVLQSPLRRKALKQLASRKLTPIAAPSSKITGQKLSIMETSEMFRASSVKSQRRVTRASRFPLLDSAQGKVMCVTSGRQCFTLCRNQGPLGSFTRMFLESQKWNSTVCSMTWRASATRGNRLMFQLALLDTVNCECGFGLLPTTRATLSNNRKWCSQHGQYLNLEHLPSDYPKTFGSLIGKPISVRWLEKFMGFPAGHTELRPSAMRLFLKSRKKSRVA